MAKKRKVANLMALAVLATVVQRPMHRYEMASLMRARGKDRDMDIKWGSLYTVVAESRKEPTARGHRGHPAGRSARAHRVPDHRRRTRRTRRLDPRAHRRTRGRTHPVHRGAVCFGGADSAGRHRPTTTAARPADRDDRRVDGPAQAGLRRTAAVSDRGRIPDRDDAGRNRLDAIAARRTVCGHLPLPRRMAQVP